MTGTSRALLAVGGYGVTLLATGAAVLLAPAGAPAADSGVALPTRTVSAAPVVAPSVGPSSTLVPAPSASGPVPEASQGRDAAARAAFRPTGLALWSGRGAPVVPAGVRSDGSLVVPDDPAVVGWWTGGAQAGEAFGHVVIAGHIDDARLGIGILAELTRAKKDQIVTLTDGGQKVRYRVVSTRQIKKADLAKDPTIFAQDAQHRLVLITCGGRFDPVAHRYDDNLVVEAVPV